jgi:hypothetical protein
MVYRLFVGSCVCIFGANRNLVTEILVKRVHWHECPLPSSEIMPIGVNFNKEGMPLPPPTKRKVGRDILSNSVKCGEVITPFSPI